MQITTLCFVIFVPLVSSIIGGRDEDRDPVHMFLVSLKDGSTHFCCGVIVHPEFILTASSCVEDKHPRDFTIWANITSLNDYDAKQLYADEIFRKDPIGQKNVRNNIAMLRLVSTSADIIKESSYIRSVRLPKDEDRHESEVGEECLIYGWGTNSIVSSQPAKNLQIASTEISNLSRCQNYNSDVNESNLCAYNSKASLCTFDIGDPLIFEGHRALLGIATDEYACAGSSGDVFTRIDHHMEWIVKILDGNSISMRYKARAIIIGIAGFLIICLNS